jgi:predicted glycoside hydrolase/deacetylase ChbG (UPF0249 family)
VRRLIINADDFGLTSGVNRAIVHAATHGVVTSTTLLANSQAFCEAVAAISGLSGRAPSVGCHVVLVDGEPLLPPERLRSLTESGLARFPHSLRPLAWRAITGRLHEHAVEAEAAAQMEKIQAAGVRLSHFDAHKHAHLFPAVLRPLLRAAQTCGVRAVRNPFTRFPTLFVADVLHRPHLWKRYSQVRLVSSFESKFRRMVADAGLVTIDGCFGVVATGALDLDLFRSIAAAIPEGTWEFVCHPGYNDAGLAGIRTRLRASREQELAVLTSPEARSILEEHGIELISFWDLQ